VRPVSRPWARGWLSAPGMWAALAASSTTCTDSKPIATADHNACSVAGMDPGGIGLRRPLIYTRSSHTPQRHTQHADRMQLLPALRHVSSTQKSSASPQTKSRFLERTASCHTAQPRVSTSQPSRIAPSLARGGTQHAAHAVVCTSTEYTAARVARARDGECGRSHLQRHETALLLVRVGSQRVRGGVHVHLANGRRM